MQQVIIFAETSMNSLAHKINKWLREEKVKLEGVSYTADHENRFYSAMLYYVHLDGIR